MEEKVQSFPQIIEDIYEFIQILDTGGQGAVCLYQHSQTQEKVAIKFEFDGSTEISVLHESVLLRKLQKNKELTRIPKYISHNTIAGKQYMIMEYLEQSVTDYLNQYEGLELEKVMCDVWIQMVEALEEFHSTSNIHRDVKPDNFRVKNGRVYLIDFGVSFEYLKNGQHIQFQTGQAFKGTLDFASINCHEKSNQSRRDDLEGLGYTILYFLTKGDIDLMKIEVKEKIISSKTHLEFARLKRKFIDDNRISPQLQQIQEYLSWVRQLQFEGEPNYQKLKDILRFSQKIEVPIARQEVTEMKDQIQEEEEVILQSVNQEQFVGTIEYQVELSTRENLQPQLQIQSTFSLHNEQDQKEVDERAIQKAEITKVYEKVLSDVFIHLQVKGASQAIYNFEQQQIAGEKAIKQKIFQRLWQVLLWLLLWALLWWCLVSYWYCKWLILILRYIFGQQPTQIQCGYCKTQMTIYKSRFWPTNYSTSCHYCLLLINIYHNYELNKLGALNKKLNRTYDKMKNSEKFQEFLDQKIKQNLKDGNLKNLKDHALSEEEIQQRRNIKPVQYSQGTEFDQKQLEKFINFVNKIESNKSFEYTYFDFSLNQESLIEFIQSQNHLRKCPYPSSNTILNRIKSIRVCFHQENKVFQMVKDNQNCWALQKLSKGRQKHIFNYIITTRDKQEYTYLNPLLGTERLQGTKYNFFKP